MKFGLATFPTAYATHPAELACAAEERGFESIFFPEHTHIPTSRRTPFPRAAELPKEYIHAMDPFVSLATCAAVTKTLKVGTGICLVREELTKGMADLDRLVKEAGRDPKTISVTVFWAEATPEGVEFYEKQGVERILFGVPPESRDTVLPLVDRYAKLVR